MPIWKRLLPVIGQLYGETAGCRRLRAIIIHPRQAAAIAAVCRIIYDISTLGMMAGRRKIHNE